jgi:hypothetical protein
MDSGSMYRGFWSERSSAPKIIKIKDVNELFTYCKNNSTDGIHDLSVYTADFDDLTAVDWLVNW